MSTVVFAAANQSGPATVPGAPTSVTRDRRATAPPR